jgi:hypothetical protein
MHRKCYLGNTKGRDDSGDLGVGLWIILEWNLEKQDVRMLTGFIRLRIGAKGGLF